VGGFCQFRRMGVAAVGFIAAIGFSLTGSPTANADYIEEPYPIDAPPGPSMGHAFVTTEPGGIVKVHVLGRYDALGSAGPYGGGCRVGYGWTSRDTFIREQFITLDETGSGVATFGPGETTATYDGWCGSLGSISGTPTDLFNPHPEHCRTVDDGDGHGPYHACTTTGYTVVLDGGAPITAPDYPQPPPVWDRNKQDQTCTQRMRQTFDEKGMSADLTDLGLAMMKAPRLALAERAFGACALLSDDPNEAFLALCNVGRSLIPADWAYLAVELLGKAINNDQIEEFGRNTGAAWDQQCR